MAKLSAIFVLALIGYVAGHGMLLEPVGRASRWRYDSSAPANYNDNEVWCGGLGVSFYYLCEVCFDFNSTSCLYRLNIIHMVDGVVSVVITLVWEPHVHMNTVDNLAVV